MPYLNEHACRVVEPSRFKADSFRRKDIAKGISIIIGQLRGNVSYTTQAYRFDTGVFTSDRAKIWLKNRSIKCLKFEVAKKV